MDRLSIQKHVEELQQALSDMHKAVTLTSEKLRKIQSSLRNMKRKAPNFIVGDFVLIGLPEPTKKTGQNQF